MWSIRRRTLSMIMEASRDSMPKEFGALLRAEGDIIYEIALMPGTIQGDRHTTFYLYNKPIDFSLVGSVHSHPSGVTLPSDADRHMFSNTGPIHIIVGYPFTPSSFSAYNRKAQRVDLKVI
ncbi:MAG: Mov34/MPN/PAD-1 family protein [Thermoplasmataceae archaeon]